MGLRFMEHILILTPDPDGTRDWWCKILGFREGDHPDFGFPVHWLYIGDQDVIHIGKANYSQHQNTYLSNVEARGGVRDTGAIDHVCFNCEGIEDFVSRLETGGVEFKERQANDGDLFQLFFRDPINGIKVELNFAAAEAERAGRKPTQTAADARAAASATAD
jgi:catechol 2,3-dioxygenase-like lactoylglutathione lyase family enzyme